MPQSKLYTRLNEESELVIKANEKRFEKYSKTTKDKEKEKPHEEQADKKDKAEPTTKKSKAADITNPVQRLNDLFKIKLDVVDPNKIDLEQLYQDNLPPETKKLEEFVEKEITNKESNNDKDIEMMKKKNFKKLSYIKEDMIPEDGRN